MKPATGTFLALLLLISSVFKAYAQPPQYRVDSELSSVAFATTKLQYVIEPAYIDNLRGGIDLQGNLNIDVPIAAIQTGVDIRNQRLNNLFFNSELHPLATVSASIPEAILKSESLVTQLELSARVSLFSKTQTLQFTVNIVKTGEVMAVSTVKPVIVRASSFGIPAENLMALAKTVGGIPISDAVPLTFSLILRK